MTPTRPNLVIHAAVTLSLVALVAMCGPEALAQANTRADQVRTYNAQVLQAQSELRRAKSSAETNAARTKAAQVLEARAAALGELIAVNPAQAEALAFPAGVLKDLAASFPESKSKLEQRGNWAGELEYLIEDDTSMTTHRDIYKLRGKSETLDVNFSGKAPPTLRSGQKLDVGGVRIGKAVAVSEVQVTDAGMDATTSSTTSTYPATCAATGPQSVVSILVNLPGYTLPTATTQDFIRGALLGNAYGGTSQSTPDWSVDDFWRQNSDGKTFVDPSNTTVVGPISVSSNFNTDSTGASYCDYYGLRDAVMKAVDGQVDFKRYNRIQIVFPANGACSWSGMANVGCRSLSTAGDGSFTSSVAWQKAGSMTTRARAVQLSTHEFGHTFGLRHASSRDYGAEPLGSVTASGTLNEYGDVHSTMGSWNFGFYAASHAANSLGWLSAGANYQVVETSGTYTIQNYEARPAGVKALKIRRGTGNDAWLWIESRQNTGIYSSQLNSSLFNGALIHYQDSSTGDYSHLVDFTGGTSSFSDAPLAAGQTWADPYSNVSVTVSSVTPTATTLTVNYGSLPCTTAAPTITAAPTSVATSYGSSTDFTITVKNNSSSGCAAEAFDLAGVVPSGWSQAFGSGKLTINPGQQAQTTLKVGVPSPYALGTYTVTASATSAASTKKASDSESVTVTEPMYRLSLGFGGSGAGSVAFSAPVKTCTSACTADYTASANAIVTLTATAASRNKFSGWSGACTGTSTTCTVTMSASKSVTASFAKTTGKK